MTAPRRPCAVLDEFDENALPGGNSRDRPPALLDGALAGVDAILEQREGALPPFPVSPLASYGVWLRLGLPDPAPDVSDAPEPGGDFSPILRKILVRGVRALRNVEIELPEHDATKGQSVLLLGKNGSGKTTLLRALDLRSRRSGDHRRGTPPGVFAIPQSLGRFDGGRVRRRDRTRRVSHRDRFAWRARSGASPIPPRRAEALRGGLRLSARVGRSRRA